MIQLDYNTLVSQLVGASVSKPVSGNTSGHAAGEPFDQHVYRVLQTMYPGKVYRQYEFLNALYTKNSSAVTYEQRRDLLESPAVLFLLGRGVDSISNWSPTSLFEEKQNDTADILLNDGSEYEIIDVKTRSTHRAGQPPNIISAYKLAQMCAIMIDNDEFGSFNIAYVGIDWELRKDLLVCTKAYYKHLFLTPPSKLYINWTAGFQIQVAVSSLDQSYSKGTKQWAYDYIRNYVEKAKARIGKMEAQHITPFLKYLT